MPSPKRLLAPLLRAPERASFDVELADGRVVPVLCVRDTRSRRVKLSVDERGARLSLPLRASAAAGERFVREHRDWLGQQIDRHALDALPELVRGVTATLPLRGASCALDWREGRFTCLELNAAGGDGAPRAVFTVAARAGDAAIHRALRDFYEAQARGDVGRWLPRHAHDLPRPLRRVVFKVMSSQWGSLAPDGTMALDLSLVLARPSAFEYVLVHELCHLIRPDHSRMFWDELEARFPDWRDERDYFRSEGRRLKATLRGLLGG